MIALARKQDFAQYLRNARIKRRLSVAQVAEQVGVRATREMAAG
jgi:transcriptional regulator with XRE-family HTH domain